MCGDSAGMAALPQANPQGVLPPPLLFCPSTPWTPPKTKASLWSWPTGPWGFFYRVFCESVSTASIRLGGEPRPARANSSLGKQAGWF